MPLYIVELLSDESQYGKSPTQVEGGPSEFVQIPPVAYA